MSCPKRVELNQDNKIILMGFKPVDKSIELLAGSLFYFKKEKLLAPIMTKVG